jgi:heat shock protein HslJ
MRPSTLSRLVLCSIVLAGGACAVTDPGPPVLPGKVSVPPPPMTAAGDALLTNTPWTWQGTQMKGGARIVPDTPARYTITFQPGGKLDVAADCNRGSGSYLLNDPQLSFGPIAQTRMACPPGSRDADFVKGLAAVTAQGFDGNTLLLTLGSDGGTRRFAAPRQ